MPTQRLDENEIRKIAAKYVYNVRKESVSLPNIQKLITEALKKVASSQKGPGQREFDPQDIGSVIAKLKKKATINDKTIFEAAKDVMDHSAMEDLRFVVSRNVKQLGKKATPKDIDAIIQKGKLNPYQSSLQQIKQAVINYFTKGRPLEEIPAKELLTMIRSEMGKSGPVDERDVKNVLAKFTERADQDAPFDLEQLRQVIHDHVDSKKASMGQPVGPKVTQTSHQVEPGKEGKATKHEVKAGSYVGPKDPKNMTFFEKIRLKLRRYGIKSLSRGARNWLTDEVGSLKKMDRNKLLAEGDTVADALIGKMFMYFYNAKTKKELPYWDKFPLIFVIELYNDGWLGLNLHYLPLAIRVKLFDKLLQYANDKSLDKITKLRLSYALLKSVSRFPEVRPCIKRYLSGYVKSELLPVAAVDWEIALFLPVEQFQKEAKETVWKRSQEKIAYLKKFKRGRR